MTVQMSKPSMSVGGSMISALKSLTIKVKKLKRGWQIGELDGEGEN